MKRRLFVFFLGAIGAVMAPCFSQTEIGPYASEADLGALIGQKAKVEGVYHRDAFNAPAIVVSGQVFYLLENPPNNRAFGFPAPSSYATVTGTLYLYDGSIQFSGPYEEIGRRYYFFSMDDAKLEFGAPLKDPGAAPAVVPNRTNSL